jgi:hypothetical protein
LSFSSDMIERRALAFAALLTGFGLLPRDVPPEPRLPTANHLESGDIVLVRGRSLRTAVVRLFEGNDDSYSHAGLVVLDRGMLFVIHASPDGATERDRVVKEPWSVFVAPERVSAVKVLRLASALERRGSMNAAVEEANRLFRDAVPFDHKFDLSTADRVYCTELVWRAYKLAGVDLRSDPSDDGVIMPSQLDRSPKLKPVNW